MANVIMITIRRRLGVVWLMLFGTLVYCAKSSAEGSHTSSTVRMPEMALIKGGEFLMGNPVSDKSSFEFHEDELPQRSVRVADFHLSRFLVTAKEFCVFLNERGNNGYVELDPAGRPTIEKVEGRYRPRPWTERCPACWVTWSGAVAYCSWLSDKTGVSFRLPTEAEWEYAARGVELRPWPWGDEDPNEHSSNPTKLPFYDHYGDRWIYHPWSPREPLLRAPVGSFPKNATPEGILDMLGYIAGEWCADVYDPDRGAHQQEPTQGRQRVVRGYYRRASNITTEDILKEKENAKTLLQLMAEPSMPRYHPGYSWTRLGRGERTGQALLRLAMDAKHDVDKK